MNLKQLFFFGLAMSLLAVTPLRAQSPEADSIDVLHYDLTLDLGHRVAKQLTGVANITFVITRPCSQVTFDLIADTVHPVSLDGTVTRGFQYDPDDFRLTVYVGGNPGDTHLVSIPYTTRGHVESYGFGGMHMDNGIHYNLAAAFMEYPHCYGRVTYPCRDNFYDKATYTYRVTSKPGWRSLCSGLLQLSTPNPDGSLLEVWQLSQPSPTYISSVSSAPWHVIQDSCRGLHESYPLVLGYGSHDSANVVRHFAMLNQVVPMFESCFGPYRWDRIGYISTPMGSMEHAQNIALVSTCMADVSSLQCEMTTCHELGHAWFGNLITCATAGDMWINEGGASFCEEVANEAIHGKASSIDYYQKNLRSVILGTHLSDNGYRPLHDIPEAYTYGSTTYNKGALVWHSLRGVMGDSLFYACMRRLFDRCAFGNLDAYALRDSLSLYSGIDLTGFFDFHVFNPGFVAYYIEEFGPADDDYYVHIRQRLRGTDHYASGCRVPVTFFSLDGTQQQKEWFTIDNTDTFVLASLPFQAAYAILDFDHDLSDARTDGYTTLGSRGLKDLPLAFCKVAVPTALSNNNWVHVGHHYVTPFGFEGGLPEGVQRVASRFWQVTGSIPRDANVTGQFFYNRGSTSSAGAAFLDDGFYDNRNTLDSLALFYRRDVHHLWQCVSRTRTSSSNVSSGYFTAPLYEGMYTLAVVDTAVVGISELSIPDSQFSIYPNPAGSEFRVELGSYDKKFNLSIFDTSGRKVLEMRDIVSGATVRHNLPAGTYIVLIQNNFLSLQSQIIVQ